MTDQEFVEQCYQKFLGRPPDPTGLREYTASLASGALLREDMMWRFFESAEYRERLHQDIVVPSWGEFVPPGHYYSAIPSDQDRAEALARPTADGELPGIDSGLPAQRALLDLLRPHFADCEMPEEKTAGFRYHFLNRSYSFGDGLTLYAMLRHLRPPRVIEVGSGYSSALMLDVNERHLGGTTAFTFIEPYTDLLRSLLGPADARHRIIEDRLQATDLTVFDSLQDGDMLFIDSTHVAKLNSDVKILFDEILPRLRPGVYVHIHDIHWPFEYSSRWIQEKRAWNEAYVLRAFLQYNSAFEIVYFSSLLFRRFPEWFAQHAPSFARNPGGNIWLRRKPGVG